MQRNAIQQLWGCSPKSKMDVHVAQTKWMTLIKTTSGFIW